MAKKIAIMNEKGGVGKTATATTMAYLLTSMGYKTLLLDFDGQAHSTIINGVNPNNVTTTISTLLNMIILDKPLPDADSCIYKNENGVHLVSTKKQYVSICRLIRLRSVSIKYEKLLYRKGEL